jgi:hypothetical protein
MMICHFDLWYFLASDSVEKGILIMKSIKVAALTLVGTMLTVQPALAGDSGQWKVPEMDGSGAIIAIGLVIGLVALIREKFFHK